MVIVIIISDGSRSSVSHCMRKRRRRESECGRDRELSALSISIAPLALAPRLGKPRTRACPHYLSLQTPVLMPGSVSLRNPPKIPA